MSKPLHAGKAACNGLLAARLAARGFTSNTDILGAGQGFADTQSTTVDPAAMDEDRPQPWVTQALFKYHAACYLTHNAIEAANARGTTVVIATHDRSLLARHRKRVVALEAGWVVADGGAPRPGSG